MNDLNPDENSNSASNAAISGEHKAIKQKHGKRVAAPWRQLLEVVREDGHEHSPLYLAHGGEGPAWHTRGARLPESMQITDCDIRESLAPSNGTPSVSAPVNGLDRSSSEPCLGEDALWLRNH